MNIDAGLSIVVSFVCFAWIFAKKVYPVLTKALDDHIAEIKKRILDVEKLRDDASKALREANAKNQSISAVIEENKKLSADRIALIKSENDKYLSELRQRYQTAMQNRLDAELAKQKEDLVNKVADIVLQKLSDQVRSADCKIVTEVTREDLKKLI